MTSNQQQIQFNGQTLAIEPAQTVSAFLEKQSVGGRFIVVINDEVVPKSNWDQHAIQAGDQIEIMSPISGG
ncbi:MAG: sulfur carrier protein ThiS [Pseudomonadota bacterium]|nr:sulfur carrier protein ThiS [Pseudomonadota bacterium]